MRGDFTKDILANKSLIKAADLAVLEGDYYKAADYYKSQADWATGNGLMRHSTKPYLFKATLCYLAVDLVQAAKVIEEYLKIGTPGDESELNFLRGLLDSIENKSSEDFTAQVAMYRQKRALDDWQEETLKIASHGLEGPVDDFA
ncbi:soluble NSF attachment protein [Aspergillus pseudoustus]|uniref:Soluble NSF attachment protein n=1 Tax=Aspergillus pseudoustus TaxID=1810923 RepID=A0ABR4INJ9_9EURO